MAAFKTRDLPLNDFISYVTFSRWDDTAGPSTKCVWIPTQNTPDTANIKVLTRLILKTEVTRNPVLTDIDCNTYMLPELSACAVTYLFGAICTRPSNKTIYCLTFIYKIEHRCKYLQWSDILDGAIKEDIVKYKALLHKDFEDRCTISSNRHLDGMVIGVVSLMARLESTRLDSPYILEAENYICNPKRGEKEEVFLIKVISAMILTFNRVIVVGHVKAKNKVNKWVVTLSLLLTHPDRNRCFTCRSQGDRFIPNALVQGLLTSEDVLSVKPADESSVLTLYTKCVYPLTVVELTKKKVYMTTDRYALHQISQRKIRQLQLVEILYPMPTSSMEKLLIEAKKDYEESSRMCGLVTDFVKQVSLIDDVVGKRDYIEQYMTYLRSLASGVIEYFRDKCVESASDKIPRAELIKYLFLRESDLDVVLCLAEAAQPGVYELVADGCVASKSEMVNNAI